MADIQANTPDPLYDLVGTLYHALKQAAAAERHAADAQRGRDTELAALFQDCLLYTSPSPRDRG